MYLALTDGVTTLDLIWKGEGSPYQLAAQGWAPAIATRNADALAPRRYTDVAESITLHVHGASASDARNNLATLIRVCEAGAIWQRGERRADWPVQLVYLPTDAAAINGDMWRAVCYAEINRSAISVAPTYHQDTNSWVIRNVQIRLMRRGLWCGPRADTPGVFPVANAENIAVTTATNGYGRVVTLTMTGPNDDVQNPYLLAVTKPLSASGGQSNYIAFVGTPRDDGYDALITYAAKDMAGTSGYTSAASAAGYSTHGNVLRFTPPVANTWYWSNPNTTPVDGVITFRGDMPTVVWLATMRSVIASGAPTYRVVLSIGGPQTNEIVIDTASGDPFVAVIGTSPMGHPRFLIQGSSTATGNYLEIDNVVCLDISRPEHALLHIPQYPASYSAIFGSDYKPAPEPGVGYFGGDITDLQSRYSYAGSAELFGSNSARVVWVQTGTTDWRPSYLGAAVQPVYYGYRRRACLIPE